MKKKINVGFMMEKNYPTKQDFGNLLKLLYYLKKIKAGT